MFLSVYRMSRTIKDKYENATSRRNHTVMTPEEAAAGKKTNWSEVEITGKTYVLNVQL